MFLHEKWSVALFRFRSARGPFTSAQKNYIIKNLFNQYFIIILPSALACSWPVPCMRADDILVDHFEFEHDRVCHKRILVTLHWTMSAWYASTVSDSILPYIPSLVSSRKAASLAVTIFCVPEFLPKLVFLFVRRNVI